MMMQYSMYCMYISSCNHSTAPAAPCSQKPQLSLSLSIAQLHGWSLPRLGVMIKTRLTTVCHARQINFMQDIRHGLYDNNALG